MFPVRYDGARHCIRFLHLSDFEHTVFGWELYGWERNGFTGTGVDIDLLMDDKHTSVP